ncbi:MAG: hypothetical protein OIF58_04965 [Cohaesibacter sp.]|nr:hypothetical protein [Cohaesibacter sp.]
MQCDEITSELLNFILEEDNAETFDSLAKKVFAYQFGNNLSYAKFARSRGKTPRTVKTWTDIPAVPINAFKTLDLTCCAPADAAAIFMTSGTTQGGIRGKNYHSTLRVYDASMRQNFAARVMQGKKRIDMGILFPTPEVMPNSSLAHYLNLAVSDFGSPGSGHLITDGSINFDRLISELRQAEATGTPYALLGASFSLVHVLDEFKRQGLTVKLPEESLIFDTGGFKGQSRELDLDEFYDALSSTFGMPRSRCINMYGMTELGTQFYDNGNEACPSVKSGPGWIRTQVVNPLSGMSVPKGEKGILAHTDLANFNSAVTILTEDVGIETDDGFLLLGRAEGTQAQGCSLAVDEFLKAAGSA